jgi:hypothetical protein
LIQRDSGTSLLEIHITDSFNHLLSSSAFTLTLNQPPSFTLPLQDHILALGSTLTYALFPFLDPDATP